MAQSRHTRWQRWQALRAGDEQDSMQNETLRDAASLSAPKEARYETPDHRGQRVVCAAQQDAGGLIPAA